ncbi:hypothetical protein [Sphingobacterium tabacisoli]|uniref:Uncharacterized protein n=1 Tax=Sphingobacterium tabacisoli TaxID=2044855 RepID=A0ABW5L5J4_9SPHI|nr:hypothetical protein [Sphingobacterium tabacisoli]
MVFINYVDPENDFIEDDDQEDGLEVNDLTYDEEKGSYRFDVDDDDPDWDHPADYDTLSQGAQEDLSTYDVSNPFVGSEYANLDNLKQEDLERSGMRITDKKNFKLSKLDKEISKDEEDYRDDLDEEGYPKRD